MPGPACANGIVAAAVTSRPVTVTQRAPTQSVSLPAQAAAQTRARPKTTAAMAEEAIAEIVDQIFMPLVRTRS